MPPMFFVNPNPNKKDSPKDLGRKICELQPLGAIFIAWLEMEVGLDG